MNTNELEAYAYERIVLFDGVCKLCNAWVRFLLKFDTRKRFKLCSVQSEQGQSLLYALDMPTDRYETMVLLDRGRVWTQSDAFLKVVGQLPMPWPLLKVLYVVPGVVRNGLYDRIASNRYRWFGRQEACRVPDGTEKDHFVKGGW
ncbi:thiol-disulfide oxidoreductase DCC family protein [Saccharospirillum salsuginis]|nr:thiol-disulfide oxidoreductase DCC family protein [Saccharospirillum salsuginis]